ncbi:MAG: hypothetical protein MUF65_10410 [Rubritepida sp.]|nr:hypothetical protein [Rubritepida sp.]
MAPHSGWRRGAAAALLGLGLLAGPGRPHARAPSAPVRLDAGAGPRSATELAKAIQNPIGDLYSFPFQNNVNLRVGPNRGTRDILNIQPVIPIHLHADWNIITRTILPLV